MHTSLQHLKRSHPFLWGFGTLLNLRSGSNDFTDFAQISDRDRLIDDWNEVANDISSAFRAFPQTPK